MSVGGHNGLEVFLQKGLYGVMRNGKVTCPARFKRVERLRDDCGFFALGVYVRRNGQGLGELEEVTTVIDRHGRDLKVTLYGTVGWRDGYFYGEQVGGGYVRSNSWDPVGGSYYDGDPCFMRLAGVEVGFAKEHGSTVRPCLKLRVCTGRVSPRFNVGEVFYNRSVIIARDYLVVKRDKNHAYRVRGYLEDSVLVESEETAGYQQVMLDGRYGRLFVRLPEECRRVADMGKLGLRRARLG